MADNGTWLHIYHDYDPDEKDPQHGFLVLGEKEEKQYKSIFFVKEISPDTVDEILSNTNKSIKKFLEEL